jgi:hypothetical protein
MESIACKRWLVVHLSTTPPPPRCTTRHFLFCRAVEKLYKPPSGPLCGCRGAGNCVKPATEIPEFGRTVVKTTETRVLPADPLTGERKTPDYFEYVERLSPGEWERHPKHTLYIYRRNTETGPMIPLERLNGFFPVAGADPVPLGDREEFEIALAQKYGGGNYRLILKKGSERISEGRISIDGAPKNTRPGILDSPEASGSGATVQNPPETPESVAKTAMNIVANQESQGLQIGMAALHSAADVVQRLAHPSVPAPAPGDDLTRQFLQVMIAKMMNPPDPLEQFAKFASLMATLGGGANGTAHPAVQKIIDTALERFGNPVAPGAIATTGAALVSQLPQIAGYVTEAVREWRVGSEAQLHTAQIMASQGRAPALAAQNPSATVQPPGRPITQATQIVPPPQEAQAMPAGTPSLEFVESKIVEILRKPISADDAADEVLSFLDLMDPTLVDRLAAVNETQLVQLFQTRPVLKQYHDLARLQEFVRAFLKYANDTGPADGVESTKPVKPN